VFTARELKSSPVKLVAMRAVARRRRRRRRKQIGAPPSPMAKTWRAATDDEDVSTRVRGIMRKNFANYAQRF